MKAIYVNGTAISATALDQAALQLGTEATPEAVARAAVARELLHQRAREKGLLNFGGDEGAAIERLLDLEVKIPGRPTEAECLRFYEAHPESFQSGELVYARHILFAVTPGAPLEAIRHKAELTLHELLHHPDRFAQFAHEYSNCPSGAQQGNLGQLARGETVPEFESALFDEKHNGILPRLVRTRYGFHIVAIEQRIAGSQIPFSAVRDKIETYLMGRVQEKALSQYVKVLAGQADIRGVEIEGAATPLVQ